MNFIEKILSLISKKEITKNKMLTDLKLSKNSIIDWKNRGTVPNGETLSKIADYFNVTIEYLLENERSDNIKVYDEKDNIIVLDNETLDIIDSLRKRPDMKMLFSVSKKATKEDILQTVKIIEALKGNKEGE
jgi:transcriptional regulator with XRE-family HTH domain